VKLLKKNVAVSPVRII